MRIIAILALPPIVGSLIGTLAIQFTAKGTWDPEGIRVLIAFFLTSLLFTVPSSGMLAVVFSWMRDRFSSMTLAYVAVALAGSIVGDVLLSAISDSAAMLGLEYGTSTALAWVLVHRMVDGNPATPGANAKVGS